MKLLGSVPPRERDVSRLHSQALERARARVLAAEHDSDELFEASLRLSEEFGDYQLRRVLLDRGAQQVAHRQRETTAARSLGRGRWGSTK